MATQVFSSNNNTSADIVAIITKKNVILLAQNPVDLQVRDSPGAKLRSQNKMAASVDMVVNPFSPETKKPAYTLKGHIVQAYTLKGHIVEAYTLKGHIVEAYTLKGHIVEAYTLKGHIVEAYTLKGHIVEASRHTH